MTSQTTLKPFIQIRMKMFESFQKLFLHLLKDWDESLMISDE